MSVHVVLRILATLALLVATTAGCFFNKPPRSVVNAGASTPLEQRESSNAWDGLNERSAVVAYEFGACESDADCAPRGCDGAVCSPDGFEGTCMTDPVASCLADLRGDGCGCVEGFCRWARSPQVMACSTIIAPRAGSRPYYGGEGEAYPYAPYD